MARRRAAAPYCSSSFSNWAVCWTGRFAWGEGEIEQRFALGDGLLQTAARRGVECLALDLEHRFLMSGIEHELVAIIGTYMAGGPFLLLAGSLTHNDHPSRDLKCNLYGPARKVSH